MDQLKRYMLLAGIGLLVWPLMSRAQITEPSIRVVTPVGLVQSGDIIPAQIQIDSAGQNINAAEVLLQYNPNELTVISVTREQSIFTLWPEPPSWNNERGQVSMAGGRPGGLYASNAAVATVYFRAIDTGSISLRFDNDRTAAYAHDGQGTRIALASGSTALQIASDLVPRLQLVSTTHPLPEYWSHGTSVHVGWVVEPDTEYSYAFSTNPEAVPDDSPESELGSVEFPGLDDGVYYFVIKQRAVGGPWSSILQRRFLIDGTAPLPFEITLLDPATVNRQPVISWNATDQLSGIVEYRLSVNGRKQGGVTSPLTLKTEWLGKKLEITAIDAAGNTRTAIYQAGKASQPLRVSWWLIIIGCVLVIAIAESLVRSIVRQSR